MKQKILSSDEDIKKYSHKQLIVNIVCFFILWAILLISYSIS